MLTQLPKRLQRSSSWHGMILEAPGRPHTDASTHIRTPVSTWIASILILGAFACAQPNVLSFGSLSPSIYLAGFSIVVVLLADRGHATWLRSSGSAIFLILLASIWQIARSTALGKDYQPFVLGTEAMGMVIVALAFLISNSARARFFAQLLIVVLAILSASSFITAALTTTGTVIEIGKIPLGGFSGRLLFPFTPTSSIQTAFGVPFPRFIGIGREPGWMGMYAGAAWFLVPLAFRGRRGRFWLRLSLMVGVLTPLSTGGFATFVMAASILFMTSINRVPDAALRLLCRIAGVGIIAASILVVWNAPVFGLANKAVQNADSLEERTRLTTQGWQALQTFTLGQLSSERNADISALASVVEWGWPYLLLIMAAILVPLLFTKNRGRVLAPVSVIAATLLLFQPPSGSTGAYVIVMLACGLATQSDRR